MSDSYCENSTCENYDKSVVGRFCPDCGKPAVERRPVESPPSQAVGPAPQKIMAGGDLTHNVTHTNTNTTTVYNQDETKQVQICAVSGRQAEVIKGHVCPSCGLWVHSDYFDRDTKLCSTCNSQKAKGAQQTFRDKVVEFLSDDQISKDELQFLRDFGGRLNISVVEQDNTIATIKRERVQKSSVPLSRIEKVKFDNAIKILLDDNHEDVAGVGKEAALNNLEAIYARHPNNMDVAGYLLMAYSSGPMSGLSQSEGRWAERVKEHIDTSPAFAHDTEKKYFYTCMAALGLLWADSMSKEFQENFPGAMPQKEQQLFEDMLLSADESRRMDHLFMEACSELEKAFPESDEYFCLEVKIMFEEYFTNGNDPAIKSEILQTLPESSGEISGDIGKVFPILREKLMQGESFAMLEQEKREGLSAFGQVIYWSLFCSPKDVANELIGEAEQDSNGENQDADKEQAEEDDGAALFDVAAESQNAKGDILNRATAEHHLKNPDESVYPDLSRLWGEILKVASSITDGAAQFLSEHWEETDLEAFHDGLDLNNLKELHEPAAHFLGKIGPMHEAPEDGTLGILKLNELTTLSTASAKQLVGGWQNIQLNGLTTITDEVAEVLSDPQYVIGNHYSLNGLKEISDATARSFSKLAEPSLLDLDGLTTLTTASAQFLGRFKGLSLSLTGLTELSDEAASALASFGSDTPKGWQKLYLNDYMANRSQEIKDAPASFVPPPLPGDAPPPLPGESGVPLSTTPTGDSIEVLQQIYDQAYQALQGIEKVYTSGTIPSKKIAGAVKGYLPPDQVQNTQILYDDTVFGGAKEGLCFNGHTIYFKALAEKGGSVSLKELVSFSNPDLGKIEMQLRNGTIMKFTLLEKEAAKAFENFFQAAIVLFNRLNA